MDGFELAALASVDRENPEVKELVDNLKKALLYVVTPPEAKEDATLTEQTRITVALAHAFQGEPDAVGSVLQTAFKVGNGNLLIMMHFATVLGAVIGYLAALDLPKSAPRKVTIQ